MVWKSLTLFARAKGPDEFWRKRKVFKLVAHLRHRRRNCYSLAIRAFARSLMYASRGRRLKRMQLNQLWEMRLEAACAEHGTTWAAMREGLTRNEILLNRKVLVDLAIWEPRTFKSLAKLAWARCSLEGLNLVKDLSPPSGVITRGMLK